MAVIGLLLSALTGVYMSATTFGFVSDGMDNEPDFPAEVSAGPALPVAALPALLAVADFISLGTNDLMQFFFASDRGNPRLGDRYDALSPAFLRFVKSVIDAAAIAGKPVAVCGEMAGRPLEALALVGLGISSLSMQPHGIGPVKQAIRSADSNKLAAFLNQRLDDPGHSLRAALKSFCERQGINLG